MSNKNDRWSALSLKDRADLMNMYITNGISDLKEMKKHYNSFAPGGPIEVDEGDYPADITPAVVEEEYPKTTKFFEDFTNRYNIFHNTDATNTILKTIKDDIPVVKNKGYSMYNPLTDKIYLRTQNPVEYTHELTHKLNDSFSRRIKRTEEELQILKDAYPLGEKGTHGKLYEMLISDREYFTTNTELRRRISELYDGVLGEELNSVINSMSDNELAKLAGFSGYSNTNDFYKYKDSIKTGKDLYEAITEGKEDEKVYEDLDDNTKAFYQHLYESGNAKRSNAGEPNSELLNKVRKALIRIAQNTTNENRLDYVDPVNITAFGGKINKFNSFSGEENQDNNIVYYDNTPIETPIVKAFNSEEDYNRYYGEQFGKKVTKGTNNIAQSIFEGLKYTPLIGDVLDAENAAIDAYNGNYKEALTLAGMALIPNFIEKPIKGIKRGVKNLLTYKKYVSQPERFRRSVDEIVDRYTKNANLLNSNYGGTDTKRVLNTKEDLINANKNLSITTNYIPFSRKKGGKYNGDIWINPYGKGRLKKAWRFPIEAIKDLHGTAAHEGTHFALDNLNDRLTIYDESRKYPKANPNHPLYQDVGYIFDDLNREATSWERSPEEFIAELNKFRANNNIPNHLGYNQWKPIQKRMAQTAMANRFKLRPKDASYIAPEDIDYILSKYANFGYKNGGKLTKGVK